MLTGSFCLLFKRSPASPITLESPVDCSRGFESDLLGVEYLERDLPGVTASPDFIGVLFLLADIISEGVFTGLRFFSGNLLAYNFFRDVRGESYLG